MAERAALRVLIVDDDLDMARLLRVLLNQQRFGAVEHAATGKDALLAPGRFDIILLDHQLPDTSGIELLQPLRARPASPSIVRVTAHGNEALAAEALRRGADDYLVKDASLSHLLPEVLERVRRERELRAALATAQEDLVRAERLAAIGEMTVTLHHEINNPLATISACAEALESRLQEGAFTEGDVSALDDLREYLGLIRSEAFHCKSITNGLLNFSRSRTSEHILVNLADVISSAGLVHA